MKILLLAIPVLALGLGTGCAEHRYGRGNYGNYGNYGYVRVPPPPLRAEVYGRAPGGGYVWTGGYWRYAGNRYDWVDGRWVQPPRGRARWERGRWDHDRRGYRWRDGRWR